MALLIVGIILFLGLHLVRVVAPGFRRSMIASLGENGWKIAYSIVSLRLADRADLRLRPGAAGDRHAVQSAGVDGAYRHHPDADCAYLSCRLAASGGAYCGQDQASDGAVGEDLGIRASAGQWRDFVGAAVCGLSRLGRHSPHLAEAARSGRASSRSGPSFRPSTISMPSSSASLPGRC